MAPASASPERFLQGNLPDGVFGALMASPSEISLLSDGSFIRMVVDRFAICNYLDPSLTPGFQGSMRDVELHQVPLTIVAVGKHFLKGVASGTVCGIITDAGGNQRDISFRVVVVRGLGANLFSVTWAMRRGIASLFGHASPRLEKDGVVVPLKQHGTNAAGDELYPIDVVVQGGAGGRVELGNPTDGLAIGSQSRHFESFEQENYHSYLRWLGARCT